VKIVIIPEAKIIVLINEKKVGGQLKLTPMMMIENKRIKNGARTARVNAKDTLSGGLSSSGLNLCSISFFVT